MYKITAGLGFESYQTVPRPRFAQVLARQFLVVVSSVRFGDHLSLSLVFTSHSSSSCLANSCDVYLRVHFV